MLYVKFDTDQFRYEIEDVIKLFFDERNIEIVDKEPPKLNGGVFLISSLSDSHILHLKITTSEGTKEMFVPVEVRSNENTSYENRKKAKREIKRNIYSILSASTGKALPWGMLTGIRPAKIVHEMFEQGKEKNEIIKKLTEYYRVSPKKSELLYHTAEAEKDILKKSGKDTVCVYIGIPFCKSRCIYCSFTSNPIDKCGHLLDDYIISLKKEINYIGDFIRLRNLKPQSIYIGGGTPTSLNSKLLEELIRHIEGNFCFDELEEFTLEAGRPDTIDIDKLNLIKNSRVSRISINPQSMNDGTLKLIGRDHTSADVIHTFDLARCVGITNINMDVIAGLPGETLTMFENTMSTISALNPESLTVHTMAIKRASKLKEDWKRDDAGTDVIESMIATAETYASVMNMHPYYLYRQKNMLGNLENIGYCRAGYESIYNIQIMEERQTVIAAGAGAITKAVFSKENRIERAFNVKNVEDYIYRIDEMIERKKALLEELQ